VRRFLRIAKVTRRALGWWFFAEDLCSQLAAPQTDVDASDRQFQRLLQSSWLWKLGERGSTAFEVAWVESRLRSWVRPLLREGSLDPSVGLRVVAWIMTVSAVTTLVVQALRRSGIEPLGWSVPAAVATASLVTFFAAGLISRVNVSGGE
jgi:hypothetical protein